MSERTPLTTSAIELDSQHDGSIVRKAFIAEAILNTLSFPLITNTRSVLSLVLNRPSDINASSILFARLFGGLVVGVLGPILFAAIPNTPQAINSRRTAYLSLGLGEVLLIPLLFNEALKGGGINAALSVRAAVGTIMMLAPPLLWRIYVLFVNPGLMGRYKEVKRP